MNTPQRGGRGNQTTRNPSERTPQETVGTVEHYLCGLTGSLATMGLVALFYPTLVAVTRPLHILSTTALVVILTTVWIGIWFALELAWEWRASRLPIET